MKVNHYQLFFPLIVKGTNIHTGRSTHDTCISFYTNGTDTYHNLLFIKYIKKKHNDVKTFLQNIYLSL